MLSFWKRIRFNIIQGNRIYRYLLYALGELILVVLGILIALQIDTWNNKRLDRQAEKSIYQTLMQRTYQDSSELSKLQELNSGYFKTYQKANSFIESNDISKTDSLAAMAMLLSQYSDFRRNSDIYQNLAVSGQLNLLKNQDIISGLQQLEQTYNLTNDLERMHWDIIINELSPELRSVVNYNTWQAEQPDRLYSVEIQNIFVESIYLTAIKDSIYRQALSEIKSIRSLMSSELAGDN